ncbi:MULTISPECIES: nucleoid-associated protein [Alteromonas]|uniref:37-kD nucleoid-associated bacterial family protein n=2 Tax=Alteromonas TaxID=226 RepID=A0AB36G062_ALTMA|nr:nucleoid-associated protein [Alteromonas macleodii]OES37853.1 37-kD nucleoid-associated bacterial family protein [Alteromonas macleodii]OES37941.1 37-kD nucleoid-associated bacterial family protein [Alteromonas macleodii]OES38120.1 37-kD nucleoid-associated bacterial family protein [Alteromonas macleodii]OES43151.1 37-kD nucleoid-associated bacterial family protein [Alteromonas macleodii]HAG31260.1 nucleoid-associated protein [Alteromonas macleodii]|tara:strand:- start:1983 stop:3080 length:1098 start_codon:yes stop_codon:yes gene_type:complete
MKIEVSGGISIPYKQDDETKKWVSTIGHSWDVTNSYVVDFAKEAEQKIRKRSKNHAKISFPPKPKSLASSFHNHLISEGKISFFDFVKSMQTENSIALKTSRVQSKVVQIFLKYKKEREDSTEDNTSYVENLLVVLLKDKSALRFNDDGAPRGTNIIDFEDVMQGAIINIGEFVESISEKKDIDVSFINGSGGTTNYFVDFFDADNLIKNNESVTNVIDALNKFLEHKKLDRTQREECISKVVGRIDYNERQSFATKVHELSAVIYSTLRKEENIEISSSSFEDFIHEYNYKVNEEFKVTKSDRDKLVFISLDTEVGELKLKKSLFKGVGRKGNVDFNSNNNELTVKTKIKDPAIIEELKKLQND